jgi:hypothetical protein
VEVAKYPLRAAPECIGQVCQHAEVGSVPVEQSLPAVCEAAAWLIGCLQERGWRPNEVNIMAYLGPNADITLHHDHRCFVLLIAVLSISGTA